MLANAKQGFWNGSRPPLGYKVVIAERRGDEDKKVLALDEAEAQLVRRIYSLYLEGDGETGSMGIKKIVSWLNQRSYTYQGKPFHDLHGNALLQSNGLAHQRTATARPVGSNVCPFDHRRRGSPHGPSPPCRASPKANASSYCVRSDAVDRFCKVPLPGLRCSHDDPDR